LFRRLEVLVDGKEKSVITAYHVSDWIDCCCVGLLRSKLTKFSGLNEGMLVQVIRVRTGGYVTLIVS